MKEIKKSYAISVPLRPLWEWLINTSNADEAMGLPSVTQTAVPGEHFVAARAQMFGFSVEWRENPFEWVEPEWFSVERENFNTFLFSKATAYFHLTPRGDAETAVDVTAGVEATPLFSRLASIAVGKMMERSRPLFRRFERTWKESGTNPFTLHRAGTDDAALRKGLDDLRKEPVSESLVNRLANHLRTAFDSDCLKMRPFALADLWNEDRMQTLRLFLYATKIGILNLEWEVLCPNCRVPKASAKTLRELEASAHCDTCRIRFDADFDRYVELRFSVNPAIRKAESAVYCIGSPSNQRHVLMQLRVPAGGERTTGIELKQGLYMLWSRSCENKMALSVSPAHEPAVVTAAVGSGFGGARNLKTGRCEIRLRNETDREALVMLEKSAWDPTVASAALVTSLQEFRRLFSSEVLAPGLGLEIKRLTFLFSDLAGSTALYEKIGDSPAFGVVREHFALLAQSIEKHDGAIVKTMGDAVMAVFVKPSDALKAALEIQERAEEPSRGDRQVKIRIGLHAGPCIAVNGNDSIDYFGTSVNVASRIEGVCGGGEIIFSLAVMEDSEVKALLESRKQTMAIMERELKGLSGKFVLHVIPGRRVTEDLEKER